MRYRAQVDKPWAAPGAPEKHGKGQIFAKSEHRESVFWMKFCEILEKY